mgnify:CR=1 FL=1
MEQKKKSEDGQYIEQGGLFQHRTLLRMLDVLDDAIIAVNEKEEIRFCNRASEKLLCHPADDLCGRLIWSIFRTRTVEVLRPYLCDADSGVLLLGGMQRVFRLCLAECFVNNCFVNVQVAPLRSENAVYYLFVLKCPGNATGFSWQRWNDFSEDPVVEELAAVQERLKGLGHILAGMLPESATKIGQILFGLSEINRSLARANLLLQPTPPQRRNRYFLAVKVMNLSVEYWLECSKADKFDLARDSGLWTVYTNPDGWERTQTLDNYFALNTLPKRPNWKKILATADFVLHNCLDPSPLREHLEKAVEQFFYSMDG